MKSCVVQSQRWNMIFCRSAGSYRLEDMRELMSLVAGLNMFKQGSAVFCDERLIDFSTETVDIRSVGQMPVSAPATNEVRLVVMVADTDLGFGVLRMLAAMREKKGHSPMVFRTMDEAGRCVGLSLSDEAFPDDIERLMQSHFESGDSDDDTNKLIVIKDSYADDICSP